MNCTGNQLSRPRFRQGVSVVVRSCAYVGALAGWDGCEVRLGCDVRARPRALEITVISITQTHIQNSHTHIHTMAGAARAVPWCVPAPPRWLFSSTKPVKSHRGEPGHTQSTVLNPVSEWIRSEKRSRACVAQAARRDGAGPVESWTCVNCTWWTSCRARRTAMPTRVMDTGAQTLASLAVPSGGVS
jgi:hypothetical protein